MKTYTVPHTSLTFSRLGYGCMQMGGQWDNSPLTQVERTDPRPVHPVQPAVQAAAEETK